MVAYTDDTFVARKQKHQLSNQIEHDKKLSEKAERNDKNYEKKIYELGDLNVRRGLSGDIAVYRSDLAGINIHVRVCYLVKDCTIIFGYLWRSYGSHPRPHGALQVSRKQSTPSPSSTRER